MRQLRPYLLTVLGIIASAATMYSLGVSRPAFIPTYLVMSITGALLIWSARKIFSGEVPWYSPHAWVLLALFLIEVAAGAAMIATRFESDAFQREFTPAEVLPAALLGLVCTAAYLLGFRYGPKRPYFNHRIEAYFSDTDAVGATFTPICVVLFLVAVAAWIYMFSIGGGLAAQLQNQSGGRREAITGAGGWVWHLARFGYAASLLMLARYSWRNPVVLAMVALYGVLLFVYGSRSFFATLLVGAVIVHQRRFKPNLSVIKLGVFLLILMAITTVLAGLRGSGGDTDAAIQRLELAATGEGFVETQLGHFTFLNGRAEVMSVAGEPNGIPFQNGRTFLALARIIPTFLYPGQKDLDTAASLYLDHFFPNRVGKVSLAVSLFTEFFLNFGWIGGALTAFAMGMVIRWLHSRLMGSPERAWHIAYVVLSALIAVMMVRLMKQTIQVLLDIFFIIFPVFLVYLPNLPYALAGGAPAPAAAQPQPLPTDGEHQWIG